MQGPAAGVVLESLIEGTLLTFETLNIGIGATAPNKFRRSRVGARVSFAIYDTTCTRCRQTSQWR